MASKLSTSPRYEERAWPANKDNYELQHILGYGSTAMVQAAYCTPRQEMCAIKRIFLESADQDELLKEMQAMSLCKHPNLVSFYTAFVVETEVWLVMKLLERGSVLDILKYRVNSNQHTQGVFSETVIATILKECLKGLEYLHKDKQIHRDVKAANILLGNDGTVMLADFGSALINMRAIPDQDQEKLEEKNKLVGTPCWMAPELLDDKHDCDEKADIWSVGITAIELATGRPPYEKFTPAKTLILTLKNDPPNLDTEVLDKNMTKKYSSQFQKMIDCCLQKEPAKRPSANQLLKDPFFKKAKNKEYLLSNVLANAPLPKDNAESRKQKVAKSTNRIHRNDEGKWEFSDDDCSDGSSMKDEKPLLPPSKADSESSVKSDEPSALLEEQDSTNKDKVHPVPLYSPTHPSFFEPPEDLVKSPVQETKSFIVTSLAADSDESGAPSSTTAVQAPPSPLIKGDFVVPILLEIRDLNQKLCHLEFNFDTKKETAHGIAQGMYTSGLLEERNVPIVATNLINLVATYLEFPAVVFPIHYSDHDTYDPNEALLRGFAQLSVNK